MQLNNIVNDNVSCNPNDVFVSILRVQIKARFEMTSTRFEMTSMKQNDHGMSAREIFDAFIYAKNLVLH